MRNFLKTMVSAIALCSALLAAADIASAQPASTDYGMRSSYMPEDATTVSQGANSDFGGMPYRGGWTRFARNDRVVAKAKPAQPAADKTPVKQAANTAVAPHTGL